MMMKTILTPSQSYPTETHGTVMVLVLQFVLVVVTVATLVHFDTVVGLFTYTVEGFYIKISRTSVMYCD